MSTTKTVQWEDGNGNIVATFEGVKDGTITISSDSTNEGIDRSQVIRIQTEDGSIVEERTVNQAGLREVFETTDGEFTLLDGGTFNTLKE